MREGNNLSIPTQKAMRYEDYQLTDFVHDPSFIHWVKNPDPESNSFWQNWVLEHPDKSHVIEQARELLLFLSFHTAQPSLQDQLSVKANIKKRIHSTIDLQEEVLPDKKINPAPVALQTSIRHWGPYYKMIALVTGILMWSAALLLVRLAYTQKTYKTQYGETKTIELPDGSTVILNANSTLRYSDNWQQSQKREIWLNGEAFFNILRKPHWKDARFIVYTDKLDIEVLGTTFNVNNRRGVVKVVLNSGKVKLRHTNSKDSLVMQPKDLVEFKDNSQPFLKKTVEPEAYSSWRHNKLIFNETPVKEIAQLLEDTYGMKVLFSDTQLANRKFTGAIPNQDIDLFLSILAESLTIDISRENQLIKISTHAPKKL